MNIPEELRYTKEHEWVRVEGALATIGITDYAQDSLGDIVYLDLPAIGATVTQLDKLGEIESVKAVSDLFSPISGEVIEVNQEVVEAPELVNADAYGKGWLLKVRLSDPTELDKLLSAQAYEQYVEGLAKEHN